MAHVFSSYVFSSAAVFFIIGIDRFDSGNEFFHCGEREQAFAGGINVAEASFLIDYRPSGGKITGAAVAEPSAPKTNVLVLGDSEFPARLEDILAIKISVIGEATGIGHSPSFLHEHPAVIVIDAGQRQFKRL